MPRPVSIDQVIQKDEYLTGSLLPSSAKAMDGRSAIYQNIKTEVIAEESQKIDQQFKEFTAKFGLAGSEAAGEKKGIKAEQSLDETDKLLEQLTDTYLSEVKSREEVLEPDEVIQYQNTSKFQNEVQTAWQTLKQLQETVSKQSLIHNITLQDIERSQSIRKSLLD